MPAFHLYLFEFPANAVVVEVWVAFHLYLLEFPANAVVVVVGVGVGGCLKMQDSFLVHCGQNLQMVEDVPVATAEFP